MNERRVTPPAGAWGGGHEPLRPTAGHGVVVVVSIALGAVLVAASSPVGGAGLIALLMLLLGCAALVVPVAVIAMTWGRAGPRIRVLFLLAAIACVLVLAFGVAGIAAIGPGLLPS